MPLLGLLSAPSSAVALRSLRIHAPAAHQIFCRLRPIGITKLESGLEQSSWHNPAALQDELRLGTQEDGAEFQHPFRGWQAQANPASSAESSHKIAVGQR